MIHTTKGTFGSCKRCVCGIIKPRRLYSVSFRKKQYWICADCIKELNDFIQRPLHGYDP